MKYLLKQTSSPDDLESFFQKLDVLNNDWQLFTWAFLKPELFKAHCTFYKFLKFLFISGITIVLLFVLWVSLVIAGNGFHTLPNHFEPEIINKCQILDTFGSKWYALATFYGSHLYEALQQKIKVNMVSGICIGTFAWFFSRHSAKDFSKIGYFSFMISLFFLLAIGISFLPNYVTYLSIGLLLKEDTIPRTSHFMALEVEVSMSMMIAGILFFFTAFAKGILGYPILWDSFWQAAFCIFIVYSSIWIYPFAYMKALFQKNTFVKNPYLNCTCIPFSLQKVDNQLLNWAEKEPTKAVPFFHFLLERRPNQRALAFRVLHQAMITYWQSKEELKAELLDNKDLLYCKSPKNKTYLPSTKCIDAITQVRQCLVELETQTALALQLEKLQECQTVIGDLQKLHREETFMGHELYFEVFEHWETITTNTLNRLQQKAESVQTISFNPYARGKALSPRDPYAKTLFLDRKDLKEEMALKIATSTAMPTFLILGQRRTGKTSLLNFLPELLGARFKVISISMLDLSGAALSEVWWAIWKKIAQAFNLQVDTNILFSEDWLKDWKIFERLLNGLILEKECRLIIAFDEYQVLHEILAQHETRGQHLLNRMRDFSQRQNQVIFMFIGASNFSDLKRPQWSRYFVHAQTFRVEYLSKEATFALMTQPAPNFRLKYGENVLEAIWEKTQGHPHLLHAIGSDLVDYANSKHKNPIQMADLDYILKTKIVQKTEQPFSVFWDEFAEDETTRKIVKTIAKRKFVNEADPIVRRLLEYGFVKKMTDGKLGMRVPLFALWVKEFGY